MTRAGGALAAVAALVAVVALAFTWQPGLASLFDDSVSYLLIAQSVSPFGSASPAVLAAAPAEKYPPFFAWVIAFAGGAFDWRIAHALVALGFGTSVYFLGLHARCITGSAALGVAAALAYAFLPGAWINVKGILTEFPYMALSFAALALYASRGGAIITGRVAIILGALLAAAFLTRTIGFTLVLALLATEAWRFARDRDGARLRGLLWVAGVPLVSALLWYALRPAGGEDAYVSFTARVASEASQGGVDYALGIASANAAALRDAWLASLLIFWGEPWKPGFLLAAGLGISALLAVLARASRGEADGLYVLMFIGVLLAWPFPGQMFRLALPIIPLLLVSFLWGWSRVLEKINPATAQSRAPWGAVLPLVLCAPAVLFYLVPRAAADESTGAQRKSHIAEYYRIPSGPNAESNAAAQLAVFADLKRVGETTPPEARVMWYWPNYVALLAARTGVRLERPRDLAALASQVRATQSSHIYLADLHPRDSSRRDGHPLAPLVHARELGREVWHRASPTGTMQAVLIEIDPAKLLAVRAP